MSEESRFINVLSDSRNKVLTQTSSNRSLLGVSKVSIQTISPRSHRVRGQTLPHIISPVTLKGQKWRTPHTSQRSHFRHSIRNRRDWPGLAPSSAVDTRRCDSREGDCPGGTAAPVERQREPVPGAGVLRAGWSGHQGGETMQERIQWRCLGGSVRFPDVIFSDPFSSGRGHSTPRTRRCSLGLRVQHAAGFGLGIFIKGKKVNEQNQQMEILRWEGTYWLFI